MMSITTYTYAWKTVALGVEYQDLGSALLSTWSHIHVFRVDLRSNEFDLVTAKQLSQKHASIREFAQHSQALITLNGGFFDPNFQPLGLRVGRKLQHSPLKRISWWGVFYINDQTPHLTSSRQYQQGKHVDFAVQSGPRLIIKGNIPSLKPGLAERSALGITSDGHIIILVTENTPMTTTALAKLMRAEPLNCKSALNLDGGSSSQLITNIKTLPINAQSFANISDAIVVKGR
jgi:uncharacterized protein YigE (DUF2233 family)